MYPTMKSKSHKKDDLNKTRKKVLTSFAYCIKVNFACIQWKSNHKTNFFLPILTFELLLFFITLYCFLFISFNFSHPICLCVIYKAGWSGGVLEIKWYQKWKCVVIVRDCVWEQIKKNLEWTLTTQGALNWNFNYSIMRKLFEFLPFFKINFPNKRCEMFWCSFLIKLNKKKIEKRKVEKSLS